MTKQIKLTQNQYAIVDDEDYEYLNQWKWYAEWNQRGHVYYAVRTSKNKRIYMHRMLMNTPKGAQTDHINNNSLDNRKSNLRICSHRQNQQNLKRQTSSKYPGVTWVKREQKWQAQIQINGYRKNLGTFNNEKSAAKAYEKAVRELCGEELICKMKKS